MQTEFLRLVDETELNKLSKFDKKLMDLFDCSDHFNMGKLSIVYPDHYAAYQILKKEKNNG